MFLAFYCNDTAPTEIYTLSLHDALPISGPRGGRAGRRLGAASGWDGRCALEPPRRHRQAPSLGLGRVNRADRKSTRLNSSHVEISYAVFCLKKKTKKQKPT